MESKDKQDSKDNLSDTLNTLYDAESIKNEDAKKWI